MSRLSDELRRRQEEEELRQAAAKESQAKAQSRATGKYARIGIGVALATAVGVAPIVMWARANDGILDTTDSDTVATEIQDASAETVETEENLISTEEAAETYASYEPGAVFEWDGNADGTPERYRSVIVYSETLDAETVEALKATPSNLAKVGPERGFVIAEITGEEDNEQIVSERFFPGTLSSVTVVDGEAPALSVSYFKSEEDAEPTEETIGRDDQWVALADPAAEATQVPTDGEQTPMDTMTTDGLAVEGDAQESDEATGNETAPEEAAQPDAENATDPASAEPAEAVVSDANDNGVFKTIVSETSSIADASALAEQGVKAYVLNNEILGFDVSKSSYTLEFAKEEDLKAATDAMAEGTALIVDNVPSGWITSVGTAESQDGAVLQLGLTSADGTAVYAYEFAMKLASIGEQEGAATDVANVTDDQGEPTEGTTTDSAVATTPDADVATQGEPQGDEDTSEPIVSFADDIFMSAESVSESCLATDPFPNGKANLYFHGDAASKPLATLHGDVLTNAIELSSNNSKYIATQLTAKNGNIYIIAQPTQAAYNAIGKSFTAKVTLSVAQNGQYKAMNKTWTVTVSRAKPSIQVSDKVSVGLGKKVDLKASVKVGGTDVNNRLSYASGDTSIATVSASGVVTGKKAGSVKISLTRGESTLYQKATKTVTVTVTKDTPSFNLDGKAAAESVTKFVDSNASTLCNVSKNAGAISAKSSNDSVILATVKDNSVLIAPKKAGTATVTVTAAGNDKYAKTSKKFTVKVNKHTTKLACDCPYCKNDAKALVKGGSFSINDNFVTILIDGKTKKTKSNYKGKLSYSSSDTKIATVDDKGKVTGISEGTVLITMKAESTSVYAASSDTIKVVVKGDKGAIDTENWAQDKPAMYAGTTKRLCDCYATPGTSATKTEKSSSIKSGSATGGTGNSLDEERLNASSLANNIIAMEKPVAPIPVSEISVSSSNDKVARPIIKNGYVAVQGLKAGKATIKVHIAFTTAHTGATKQYEITVKQQEASKLTIANAVKEPGQSFNISGTLVLNGAKDKKGNSITTKMADYKPGFAYASDKTAVATVSDAGRVTAVKAGTATITVTAKTTDAFKGTKTTFKVTVKDKKPVPFKTHDLSAAVHGAGASACSVPSVVGKVTATSSNDKVAKPVIVVDKATKRTYVDYSSSTAGTATITVKVASNNDYKAATQTYKVTTKKTGTSVTASGLTLDMKTKKSGSVNASVKSQSAAVKMTKGITPSLTYVSSNPSVATVNKDGKVTAKRTGSATITITAKENGTFTGSTKKVTVSVIKA